GPTRKKGSFTQQLVEFESRHHRCRLQCGSREFCSPGSVIPVRTRRHNVPKKKRESRFGGSRFQIRSDNQFRECSLDLAPLTTSLRPRNSLSCNSVTARFASSTVCIWTKAKPFERWLCLYVTTSAFCTAPTPLKSSKRSLSVASNDKFPT